MHYVLGGLGIISMAWGFVIAGAQFSVDAVYGISLDDEAVANVHRCYQTAAQWIIAGALLWGVK